MNIFSIISMVLASISMPFWSNWMFAFIGGGVSIFFGILGIVTAKKYGGMNLAIVGLIMGAYIFALPFIMKSPFLSMVNMNIKMQETREAAQVEMRDATRKSSLNNITIALEMYNAENDSYPGEGVCGEAGVISAKGSGEACGGVSLTNGNKEYLRKIPKDPDGSNFKWSSENNYTLTARLNNGNIFLCANGSCLEKSNNN